jgi:hypothetical protein
MEIKLQLFLIAFVVVLLALFVYMLIRRKLDVKYCLVWLFSIVVMLVFCIFPGLLDSLSALLGIATPMNALFFLCIVFLACVCISLTVVVSRLSARLRTLVQNLAVEEAQERHSEDMEK